MSSDASQTGSNLAATLVRITRERGIGIERLRAEQLIAEAQEAWPGEPSKLWPKWLAEGLRCLELRSKLAELSLEDALSLVEDGALVVGYSHDQQAAIIVLDSDGKKVRVACADKEKKVVRANGEFAALVSADSSETTFRWLIVEDLEVSHEPTASFHHRPIARFAALLKPEWSDMWVIGVFAFFASVLSLATPIAVESLVNMVTFGRLIQPLVILSLMLFGFLTFAGLMKAVQTFLVEIIQRRLFARVAADLAYRFPRVSQSSLDGKYGPELANRFFDIVTLQKVVAQLLLDGITIVLATIVGMAVLAFYHPWLLGFDVLLLLIVSGGLVALGRGAISTGIDESKEKYRLASWLEDLMRCSITFKSSGAAEFALDRANLVTSAYLDTRRSHFKVLFRQLLFLLGLQAFAGTILLGFGGWLVIQGQLTIGQLVAAELIVATILNSLTKMGKHIEGFYDVVASVDKLGYLFDLRIEPQDGLLAFRTDEGVRLRITDVSDNDAGAWLAKGLSLEMEAGDHVALLSSENAGSNDLFDILYGLRAADTGHVVIENADPRDLRPDVLRKAVTLVRGIEIFEGTIAENIQLGRAAISMTDVRSALYAVGLLDDVLRLPDGLDTQLKPAGLKLLATHRQLLMLARAIAGRPRLLLIDGALDVLADVQLQGVCEMLQDEAQQFTLLVATNRRAVAEQFAKVILIDSPADSAKSKPSSDSGVVA